MKLAISGTYSSGKTLTTYALSHYVGIPGPAPHHARAATGRGARQDPGAVHGRGACPAHRRRPVERVVRESHLTDFVSDGSSLQEWIYGSVRVVVGINPNDSAHLRERVALTPELEFFQQVMEQLGVAIKQHVRDTYEAFVHLPNELTLARDGHRPVNERFRSMADEAIGTEVDALRIPRHVVGGTLAERLSRITKLFGFTPVVDMATAIELARDEYVAVDMSIEADRAWAS